MIVKPLLSIDSSTLLQPMAMITSEVMVVMKENWCEQPQEINPGRRKSRSGESASFARLGIMLASSRIELPRMTPE